MAEAGVAITVYNQVDSLVAGNIKEKLVTIASGEGELERGQVVAYNTSDGTWVKYVSGGSNGEGTVRAILNEAVDTTSAAAQARVIEMGEVLGTGIVGVDYVVSTDTLATPDAPTVELVAGGTLDATTLHTYKVTAVNGEGGITATGATAGATTVAASAGSAAGLVVANIAAVNTVLGDCSTTAKSVQFVVDGVTHSATFDADYTGAGALADHAALVTALNGTGYTPSSSDGAAITLTSDTTGVDSSVTITADTTRLFLDPTITAGVALSKTTKVTVAEVAGAEDYKVWRTTDAGSTWYYREMTDAEITLGYFVDDGTLTWTEGTPVTATDYSAIADMWDRKIFISEMQEGYDFRGGF